MTKYEPSHEWVKEAKLKGAMAQIADSATDHIGRTLDNTGMRDWVYIGAYVAAVGLIYQAEMGAATAFNDFLSMIQKGYIDFLWLTKPQFEAAHPEVTADQYANINWYALALAMVGAYGLLKIDITDVASATMAIKKAIAK